MKRKTRFNDGGLNRNPFQGDDIDPFSAMRDEEGGTARGRDLRAEIAAMQEGPTSQLMFDETTGKELGTRRNLETGEYYSTEPVEASKARAMPKAPPIKDVPGGGGRGTMAGRRAIDDIMRDAGGGGRGRSMGRTAADVDQFYEGRRPTVSDIRKADIAAEERSVQERQKRLAAPGADAIEKVSPESALIGGAPVAGLKALHGAAKALAPYSTRQLATAAKEGLEAAVKSGPKAGIDVAKSTAKGMKGREEMQIARTARQKSEAKAMKEAEPILQRRPDTKSDRLKRTKFDEDTRGREFSKGGSTASRRADGCAVRGKTRGKIY